MSKTTEKVKPTLVTFLLDRSGSMSSVLESTIDGFNEYLNSLKAGGDAIKFTRLQFDSQNTNCDIQKDCVAESIKNVSSLSKENYIPRGLTPLIEAAHKTIRAVEASLAKFDKKHQVVVCIQTDGMENCSSSEYSWDSLKKLIEEKTKAGWVFNFMGTGIDAYMQSGKMGIAASNTMATGVRPEHVRSSYRGMAASNMRFAASGAVADSAFSMMERTASGEDTIMGKGFTPPLDLSAGTSPAKNTDSNLDLTP